MHGHHSTSAQQHSNGANNTPVVAATSAAHRNKLIVKIVEAKELRAADVGGTSDPYAELKIVSSYPITAKPSKTRYINKTLAPVWNEEFTFYPEHPKEDILEIKVFDHDTFTKNDPLGTCEIPLCMMFGRQFVDDWRDLKDPKDKTRQCQGSVHVVLTYEGEGARAPRIPPPGFLPYPSGFSNTPGYPPQPYQPYYPPNVNVGPYQYVSATPPPPMQYPNPNRFAPQPHSSPTQFPNQSQSPQYPYLPPAQLYPQFPYAGPPQPYPQANIPQQYSPSGQYAPPTGQYVSASPVPVQQYGSQSPTQLYGSHTTPSGGQVYQGLSQSAPSSMPPGTQTFSAPLSTVPIPHHHATYPPHHQKIELPPATVSLHTTPHSGHHSHSQAPSAQAQIPQL